MLILISRGTPRLPRERCNTVLVRGREIGEPLSWLLGLGAVTVALAGIRRIADPSFYSSPYLAAIVAGFVLHELAHRQVSRRYGLRAEFVAYTPGLLLTFLSGLVPGIVILAPGYVKTLIYGYNPRMLEAVYRSVAAGPLTNIVLSAASLALLRLQLALGPWMHSFLEWSAWVNAWFAFFNLIPFPPLDGSKIISANRRGWVVLMTSSVALLVLTSL